MKPSKSESEPCSKNSNTLRNIHALDDVERALNLAREIGAAEAARRTGIPATVIYYYRDKWGVDIPRRPSGGGVPAERTAEINMRLEVLGVVQSRENPNVTLSLGEIAEVCECSREAVRLIEARAMRKVRKTLPATLKPEFFGFLGAITQRRTRDHV